MLYRWFHNGKILEHVQSLNILFRRNEEEITYDEPKVISDKGDFVAHEISFNYGEDHTVQGDRLSRNGEEVINMEPKVSDEGDFDTESYESATWQMNGMCEENEDHFQYWKLFKAIQENDWKGVEDFISNNPTALTADIKVHVKETIFHIITRKLDTPITLIEKLASKVDPKSLERLTEEDSGSAIFWAAALGNKKAAEAFVRRNKKLPDIRNCDGLLPIHEAAACGHKEIIQYLLSVTTTRLDDERGVTLLKDLISSGLYGIAYTLLKRHQKLARERNEDRRIILEALANKPLAFECGSRLGYWRYLIYNWIPIRMCVCRDAENPSERSNKSKKQPHFGSILQRISTAYGSVRQKLHIMLWDALMQLVPDIKCIRDRKLTHMQSLEIVRMMCHEGVIWSNKEAIDTLLVPMLTAAKLGIYEIVHEILKAYFYSYTFANENGHSIFHLAILHRQDKVFSLINKMNLFLWDWKAALSSSETDNILHLAGQLVPSNKVSGAALQMQREIQWFKAVESYVHPSLQEQRNNSKRTPREVFTEQHEKLVEKGEKWMKDTAASYSFVAVLIITVVFAAAFTVPGGNSNEGIPIFLHELPFLVFAVSDALALFSSTASLLMFLGILTSRYSEEDFLEALPKKLIFGLITMFFSIASMMVAFGATIYIFLSHPWKWTIIPISLLGCFPVTLFALLQFPLLVEIFLSTYRPSISSTSTYNSPEELHKIFLV